MFVIFFFQAEDGIRDLVRSRGLGDVYKRQLQQVCCGYPSPSLLTRDPLRDFRHSEWLVQAQSRACLLYTSDAADERSSVDLGGRRIIKKKKQKKHRQHRNKVIIEQKMHKTKLNTH